MEEEGIVVVMTDEEGNEFYYREEMIIPVGDERFALLVGMNDGHEHGHDCDCGQDSKHEHSCGCGHEAGDEDVLIAKIIVGEDGEEEYVEPSDDEFDKVQAAYDALMDELEGNE